MDHDRSSILASLKEAPEVGGVRQFEVDLPTEFESAWDPTSTKRDIVGPARVNYFLFQDGGINVRVDR